MAEFRRKATAVWQGDLQGGKGAVGSQSGVFTNIPYSYKTRFQNDPGTNPEEMLSMALASCYSMALSNVLSKKGYKVNNMETEATCFFTEKPEGYRITRMHIKVTGKVDGIDQATFVKEAKETEEKSCPVSVFMRASVPIDVDATLASS